ncbi:MAG: peptidoglycan-binding protein, partial [Magnetococcales bacterium]|nr:peptidoglycan-binding protein [Magnetococcales bacterium]
KAAQESAKTEIARARQAEEKARQEVSQAQIREAQVLTQAAKGVEKADGQNIQEVLAQARKMREEAEEKVQRAEQALQRAMEESKRQGEVLLRSVEARQKGEQEGSRAQEELARIQIAVQEQTRALTQAFADQEKAQAETAEARRQEAQARAEAESRAKEMAELTRQTREQEEKLAQAKALREQAEAEAAQARNNVAHVMAQAEDIKKNAQDVVAKAKEELTRGEAEWQRGRRKFLNEIKAARDEADARIASSGKRAAELLAQFRQTHALGEAGAPGKKANDSDKHLAELDIMRQKAVAEAGSLRSDVEKVLARAELAQQQAEALQKDYQQKQVDLTSDKMQDQLVELQAARERAEKEAHDASRQVAAMREQARNAQQVVSHIQERLHLHEDRSGLVVPVAAELLRFMARSGLESFSESFSRGLVTGSLDVAEQKIARETGYRLVQLEHLPPGVEARHAIMTHTLSDGSKRHMFFWKPPFWVDMVYFGQTDENIGKLQEMLARNQVYKEPVDGIAGRYTLLALVGFQKKVGLPLTGQPDAATLFLLSHGSEAGAGEKPGVVVGPPLTSKPLKILPDKVSVAAKNEKTQWVVQVASVERGADPSHVVKMLKDKGFSVFEQPLVSRETGKEWVTIRVGPVASQGEAADLSQKLEPYFQQDRLILEYHSTVSGVDGKGGL